MESKDEAKQAEQRAFVEFADSSVEHFVATCLIQELQRSRKQTCNLFIKQIESRCKLFEHLEILQKVYFMEAGHHMHEFSRGMFDKLDRGVRVDSLVMLNGHFHECIEGLGAKAFEKAQVHQGLQIVFADNPVKYPIDGINSLDYIAVNFLSDWPLEIMFDKTALASYNAVFRFLLRIKRVNYLIQQRDFWARMKLDKARDELNVKEQIVAKNKAEFNAIQH